MVFGGAGEDGFLGYILLECAMIKALSGLPFCVLSYFKSFVIKFCAASVTAAVVLGDFIAPAITCSFLSWEFNIFTCSLTLLPIRLKALSVAMALTTPSLGE